MDVYEYEGGRRILRNSEPFAVIHRPVDQVTGEGPHPSDVDAFARTIPALIDFARAAITSPGSVALERERIPAPTRARLNHISEEARRVLSLLDWKTEG